MRGNVNFKLGRIKIPNTLHDVLNGKTKTRNWSRGVTCVFEWFERFEESRKYP